MAAWLPLGLEVRTLDHDFEPHGSTGVEIFAFVTRDQGSWSGGVMLRLPGEYADSFEPVALTGPDREDPLEAVRAFFG